MEIQLLKARGNSLRDKIEENLSWAQTFNLGVAYASYGAYQNVKTGFEGFLRNNGKIRAIFDIEKFITDSKVLQEFSTIGGDCECKVYLKSLKDKEKGCFHPKFYLFFDDTNFSLIIGSSNFTRGGLLNNYEENICISGVKDNLFETFQEEFKSLWRLENCLNVLDHPDIIEDYKELKSKLVIETKKVDNNLSKLKNKLEKSADLIEKSYKKVLNENFSYLLGLIAAHSRFNQKNRTLEIFLSRGLANKYTPYSGYYYNPEISNYKIAQSEAHLRDTENIAEKIFNFLLLYSPGDDIHFDHVKNLVFKIVITFNQNSKLYAELTKYDFNRDGKDVIPFIPKEILKSKDEKMIRSFLRGYCDLKSRMSTSDGIYNTTKNGKHFSSLRMGISISHNSSDFMNDLVSLFNKIGIKKGLSATDPKKRTRELLIRIGVEHVPYDLLGTHWRRIFLKDFQYYLKENQKKYDPNQLIIFEDKT